MAGVIARMYEPSGHARTLENLVDDFERALVRQQKSPATIRAYLWALEQFERSLRRQDVAELDQLTREHLEQWQDELIARKLKPWSRALAAVAVRQFLLWAADHDLVDWRITRAIERVRKPRLQPKPIPPADLEKLRIFLLPRRPRASLTDLRTRALFHYLLASGARISEALQVDRGEVERALVRQKGGSEKTLRIPPSAVRYIDDYLEDRRDDCDALWVTHDTNRPVRRLDPAGVRIQWERVARKVGVDPFTSHQLRHTCATEMLEAGVPELVVAEHLGHHGLGTLHVYGQVRDSQREKALNVLEDLVRGPARPLLPSLRRRPRRRSA